MRQKLIATAAAAALIAGAAPAYAQAAAPLSIAAATRAGADTGDASDIRGGFILPTLAIAAIIAVLVLVKPFGGGDPESP